MFSAVFGLLGSYIEARAIKGVAKEVGEYMDRWARLIASIVITILVTFPMTVGVTTLTMYASGTPIHVALGVGFATALVVTPAVVYNLWVRSPLTAGIAIAIPKQFQETVLQQDTVITERK